MRRVPLFWLILITLFSAISAPGFAQSSCPWMNAATAGGFLGGDVQIAITGSTAEGEASCEFTRADAMLRIAVHTISDVSQEFPAYLSQCGPAAVNLKGIGNQAVRCINKGEERIIGRVRGRAFVITIKAAWINNPPTNSTKTRNLISDASENIAEQVAGSMF